MYFSTIFFVWPLLTIAWNLSVQCVVKKKNCPSNQNGKFSFCIRIIGTKISNPAYQVDHQQKWVLGGFHFSMRLFTDTIYQFSISYLQLKCIGGFSQKFGINNRRMELHLFRVQTAVVGQEPFVSLQTWMCQI